MKKETWLITGGAGFIGSNLINYLLKKKQKIICLDNFINGDINNLKEKISKNLIIIKCDIRKPPEKILKYKVHYLIHLAALGSVPRSFESPEETNSVNVDGSIKIMNLAHRLKCKSFVFASSSSVYGDSKNKAKKENDKKKPISPYGNSKLAFEIYSQILSKHYNLKTVGIRFFNVFGPNQNIKGPYAAVIPKWVSGLKKNLKIFVNGDGSTSRDFTYVENVIKGILLSAKYKNKSKYNIFNIACGREIKLKYLLKKLYLI